MLTGFRSDVTANITANNTKESLTHPKGKTSKCKPCRSLQNQLLPLGFPDTVPTTTHRGWCCGRLGAQRCPFKPFPPTRTTQPAGRQARGSVEEEQPQLMLGTMGRNAL